MEPSWIRSALAKIYPEADLDEGVDLDQNGTLEPWEEIRDDNKNGEVGDRQDWEYFYYRNQQFLDFFDGPFQGIDDFSVDNPIHDILSLESNHVPEVTISSTYEKINELKTQLENDHLVSLALKAAKFKLIRSFLIQPWFEKQLEKSGYTLNLDEESPFLSAIIASKEISFYQITFLVTIFSIHFRSTTEADVTPLLLGNALLSTEYYLAEQNKETDRQMELLGKMIELNPKDLINWIPMAKINIAQGKLAEAKSLLEQVLAIDSQYSSAHLLLGKISEKEEKYEEALKNYEKAKALGLSSEELHMGLGRVYKKLGKGSESHVEYALAGLANLQNAEAHFEASRGIAKKREYSKEAIELISKAIDLDSSKGEYYKARAEVYSKIGEHEKALVDFRRAEKLGISVATEILEMEGVIAAKQKNYPEAIRIFTALIEQDPKKSLHWAPRGVAKAQSGDYAGAIQDLNEAEKLGQTLLSDALYARGLSHQFLGNFQQALLDFSRAIAAEPANAGYHFSRGLTYAAMKEYRKAVADFEQTLQINPDHPFARSKKLEAIRKIILGENR